MIANLKKSKKKGFTLVELIVVIAIIAIIAAVAVPTTIKYVNEAKVTTAKSETSSVLSTIETGFSEIVATGNGQVSEENIKRLLNEGMPSYQHTESVVVEFSGDGIGADQFKITVTAKDLDDADVSKVYTASSYGLTIPNDAATFTLVPTSGGSGVWNAGN